MTELVREYMWTPWDIPGNEHLRLRIAESGDTQADSQVGDGLGQQGAAPLLPDRAGCWLARALVQNRLRAARWLGDWTGVAGGRDRQLGRWQWHAAA